MYELHSPVLLSGCATRVGGCPLHVTFTVIVPVALPQSSAMV